MTLEEMVAAKEVAQEEVKNAVALVLTRFQRETGLFVQGVNIGTVWTFSIGDMGRTSEVTKVEFDIRL